jgi:glycerol-3-phosphate acyltransferase PlsY
MRGLPTRDVVVCTVGAAIMGGMVIWMHRSNIQRIRDGKEYRFGQKHKSN